MMEPCSISIRPRSLALWLGFFFCLSLLLQPSDLRSAEGQNRPAAVEFAGSGPDDPDLKVGGSCRGKPSSAELVSILPTYLKELVVQWPRSGSRKGASGCVSVARLTLIDHQGLVTTLSLELHSAPQSPPQPDYQVVLDDGMPRAELTVLPAPTALEVRVVLAGPPSGGRELLERTLEFVPMKTLAQDLAAL
jgi:hypothetical protein